MNTYISILTRFKTIWYNVMYEQVYMVIKSIIFPRIIVSPTHIFKKFKAILGKLHDPLDLELSYI